MNFTLTLLTFIYLVTITCYGGFFLPLDICEVIRDEIRRMRAPLKYLNLAFMGFICAGIQIRPGSNQNRKFSDADPLSQRKPGSESNLNLYNPNKQRIT